MNDLVRGFASDPETGRITLPWELVAGGGAGACQVVSLMVCSRLLSVCDRPVMICRCSPIRSRSCKDAPLHRVPPLTMSVGKSGCKCRAKLPKRREPFREAQSTLSDSWVWWGSTKERARASSVTFPSRQFTSRHIGI